MSTRQDPSLDDALELLRQQAARNLALFKELREYFDGLKRVVDRQAEDGALWAVDFGGKTSIAEAYILQALRLLHSVIEGDTTVDQALADMEDIITEPGSRAGLRKVYVVFDGPPEHNAGRFVEVEDENGHSLRAGGWEKCKDGYWTLGPFLPVR